jgi:hypothetical protein
MNTPQSLAKHLSAYITDRQAIASYVAREYGNSYTVADINRMIEYKRPSRTTDSIPRKPSQLDAMPLAMHKPISTVKNGYDPYMKALLAYGAKHGTPVFSRQMCCELMLRDAGGLFA